MKGITVVSNVQDGHPAECIEGCWLVMITFGVIGIMATKMYKKVFGDKARSKKVVK